jgi:hypothetical protein
MYSPNAVPSVLRGKTFMATVAAVPGKLSAQGALVSDHDWEFVRAWLKPLLETTCARADCDWQINRHATVACSTCEVTDSRASAFFRSLLDSQRKADGY